MKTKEIETAPNKKTEKKSGKVLNTVVNVLLVVVIVFGAFCAFNAFMAKQGNGVPSLFGLKFASIQSDSMSPTFNKGDLIVDIVVKDPTKLKASTSISAKDGDVITFWTTINGEIVLNTHRIVEVNDNENYLSFVTRGDNDELYDENNEHDYMQVHQNKIEGKYLFAIPKLGNFIDFLETSTGFLLVVVLPAALIFIWQLIQFFRSLFAYQAEKVKMQMQMQMQMMQQQNQNFNNVPAQNTVPQDENAPPTENATQVPTENDDSDNSTK